MDTENKYEWDKLANDKMKELLQKKLFGSIVDVDNFHTKKITGSNLHWSNWIVNKYFSRNVPTNVLSIGCGDGYIERLFKKSGLNINKLRGIDISTACVVKAQKTAINENTAHDTKYFQHDLNSELLPPELYSIKFDFVFAFHSLHHVEKLENLIKNIKNIIKPNGIIMLHEYVGPSRFQFTDLQIQLINKILSLLPKEERFDPFKKIIKEKIFRQTIEEMIKADPSEAVRSSDIDSFVRNSFKILHEVNLGGTLCNGIFADIAMNFTNENKYHTSIVNLILLLEELLIENNVLPSDFKFYICKNDTK